MEITRWSWKAQQPGELPVVNQQGGPHPGHLDEGQRHEEDVWEVLQGTRGEPSRISDWIHCLHPHVNCVLNDKPFILCLFMSCCYHHHQVERLIMENGREFMWSERLGYILTCHSNLGTGLRATCLVSARSGPYHLTHLWVDTWTVVWRNCAQGIPVLSCPSQIPGS